MTEALTPRAPWWMPQPRERETFIDFWSSIGFSDEDIADSLEMNLRAPDVANERLAAVWVERNREEYEAERDAWLESKRVV